MTKTMMGLETLLEAAKYLEYQAEVEARGEKGFGEVSSNGSSPQTGSIPSTSPGTPNGFTLLTHPHYSRDSPLLNFITPPNNANTPKTNSKNIETNNVISPHLHSLPSSLGLSRVLVPESPFRAGSNIGDMGFRRGVGGSTHSPEWDFSPSPTSIHSHHQHATNGRMAKSVSPNTISGLNNRNSGTREVHNKLEKNRRAHLKECFELLKSQLPSFEDRKISNLAILRSSYRHIQSLKRKERELEGEMERLARDKILLQQRLSLLKKDYGKWDENEWRGTEDSSSLHLPSSDDSSEKSPSTPSASSHRAPPLHPLRYSESSDSSSPPNNMELDEFETTSDSQLPLSLTVNNCHITEQQGLVKKYYGQVNGVLSNNGKMPISLLTTSATKLINSSPPLVPTTDSSTTSSNGVGAYMNNIVSHSAPVRKNGFSVLTSTMVNPKHDIGQYYGDEKSLLK